MRQDQERIRNLLIDTVTLLCKNSVQFNDKLQVEGLLGVSVDEKDVFFIHISKEFSNSPANEPVVTQSVADTQEDVQRTEVTSEPESNQQEQQPSPSKDTNDRVPPILNIKAEPVLHDDGECLIVDHPSIKLEGRASSAHLIAGQRRAVKRTSTTDSQHYSSDSSYGVGNSGDGDNFDSANYGEPSSKRKTQQDCDEDGNYPIESGNGEGTPWPSLAGSANFDPTHAFQQDSDNSPLDSSQPGCSTWPSARGVSDSIRHLEQMVHGRFAAKVVKKPHASSSGYMCYLCREPFTNLTGLHLHMVQKHEKDNTQIFHMFNAHSLAPSPAEKAQTDSKTGILIEAQKGKENRSVSTGIHNKGSAVSSLEKIERCPVCSKLFGRKIEMEQHLVTHTVTKSFGCVICGEMFKDRSEMETHRINHSYNP